MATKKTRIKQAASVVFVPQNREQVSDAIAEIGVINRELTRIYADMNDELADCKKHFEDMALPYKTRAEELFNGTQIYSEANRAALTNNYKVKTVAFTTGEICWRLDTPSVRLTDTEENVIAACEAAGYEIFIRRKPSLDKNAIKADPEGARTIQGLKIGQSEAFVVTPFEVELAAVA